MCAVGADRYLNSLMAQNEKIGLIARQHWFLMLSSILLEVVLTVVVVAGAAMALLRAVMGVVALALVAAVVAAVDMADGKRGRESERGFVVHVAGTRHM